MNIRTLHMVAGAKEARGITVIIDVFRAGTVEAYLIRNGAERVIPMGDQRLAYEFQKEHPETLLIGERHGKMLEGFQYGNSPADIEDVDFTGKTLVHTTSAGTQGIVNATGASEILMGSLVTARATAEYIRKKNPDEVSLVCMGLEAKSQTEEDNLCGAYIKSILENDPIPLDAAIEGLKTGSGAKFFDPARQDVFRERDFYLCTAVDSFDFALRIAKDEKTGLYRTVRAE